MLNAYNPIPVIHKSMLFTHKTNIDKLKSYIRQANKTLEISVFAFKNDKLAQ